MVDGSQKKTRTSRWHWQQRSRTATARRSSDAEVRTRTHHYHMDRVFHPNVSNGGSTLRTHFNCFTNVPDWVVRLLVFALGVTGSMRQPLCRSTPAEALLPLPTRCAIRCYKFCTPHQGSQGWVASYGWLRKFAWPGTLGRLESWGFSNGASRVMLLPSAVEQIFRGRVLCFWVWCG